MNTIPRTDHSTEIRMIEVHISEGLDAKGTRLTHDQVLLMRMTIELLKGHDDTGWSLDGWLEVRMVISRAFELAGITTRVRPNGG